uniref:Uncharacterized protein n=1 Tax=Arundo donax TaxID=35708 RepID=A0A0A9FHH8_ARUDO
MVIMLILYSEINSWLWLLISGRS